MMLSTTSALSASAWRRVSRSIARQPALMTLCAAFMLATLIAACTGAALAPFDPTLQDLGSRLLPPGTMGAD